MTAQEVCQLSEGGLVEVGAHTVTHPVLSACSSATQRAEIQASKQCLEAILGRSVTAFSYPYGGVTAVGSEALRLVHELGFEAACTTVHTPVTRAVDRYALPRFVIGNWDGDEFTRRLGTFFAS